MCRSTPRSAGRRKPAPAGTDGPVRPSTTTWQTLTASRRPICSYIASIGRPGRSKSRYGRGPRDGDRHSPRSSPSSSLKRENSMKAFIVERYGRKDGVRFGDMPEPELRDDDVLVRVHAAGVNLLDSKIPNGEFRLIRPYRLPLILETMSPAS